MEEKIVAKTKGLIIALIILSLLVVILGGYIIYDKVLIKELNKTNNSNSVEPTNKEDDNEIIRYTFKYNDVAIEEGIVDNAESYLELAEEDFEFYANMCKGMMKIKGKYQKDGSKIILSSFEELSEEANDAFELNLRGKESIVFIEESEGNLYLENQDFGCVPFGTIYGTFQKN